MLKLSFSLLGLRQTGLQNGESVFLTSLYFFIETQPSQRGLNSFCAGWKHILKKCSVQGKHHISTSIYHASSITSSNGSTNGTSSVSLWISSSRSSFSLINSIFWPRRRRDSPGIDLWFRGLWLFQKFPARGPEVRVAVLVCGLHRLRFQA